MIKKLRRKFIIIAMTSLACVMLVIITVINAVSLASVSSDADQRLYMIMDNGGRLPEFKPQQHDDRAFRGFMKFGFELTAETAFETRFFTVALDGEGAIQSVMLDFIAAIDESRAGEMATAIYDSGREAGYSGNYRYKLSHTDAGITIAFLDCSTQLNQSYKFTAISVAVAFACVVLVFIPVAFFSRRAIRPVMQTMERQKRFITDAGHEIKTPLAIISANAEVIEMTEGESEWTKSIKNQTNRLAGLVKSLLELSKVDESRMEVVMAPFSLSDAVRETASPFEALARTQGKSLTLDIEDMVSLNGNEDEIRKLISILTDNAVKYATDGGEVKITLTGGKAAQLTVFNPCEPLSRQDLEHIFDRFYRADQSRSRQTGGYGIGLSIASSVVRAHKGKITASNVEGGVAFKVALPRGSVK